MSKEPLVGWQTNNLIGFLRHCAMHNARIKRKYAQRRVLYTPLHTASHSSLLRLTFGDFRKRNHSHFLHTFCPIQTCGIINLALCVAQKYININFFEYFESVFPWSARKMQSMPQLRHATQANTNTHTHDHTNEPIETKFVFIRLGSADQTRAWNLLIISFFHHSIQCCQSCWCGHWSLWSNSNPSTRTVYISNSLAVDSILILFQMDEKCVYNWPYRMKFYFFLVVVREGNI